MFGKDSPLRSPMKLVSAALPKTPLSDMFTKVCGAGYRIDRSPDKRVGTFPSLSEPGTPSRCSSNDSSEDPHHTVHTTLAQGSQSLLGLTVSERLHSINTKVTDRWRSWTLKFWRSGGKYLVLCCVLLAVLALLGEESTPQRPVHGVSRGGLQPQKSAVDAKKSSSTSFIKSSFPAPQTLKSAPETVKSAPQTVKSTETKKKADASPMRKTSLGAESARRVLVWATAVSTFGMMDPEHSAALGLKHASG